MEPETVSTPEEIESRQSIDQDTSDVSKEQPVQNPCIKPTAFTLFQSFCEMNMCVNINGKPHLFDSEIGCYRPFDKNRLINFLFKTFYNVAAQSGSLRIIKGCAELIMLNNFPEVYSAESQMILCFQNGFLPLSNIDQTQFATYQYNPYPTYKITAQGFFNMSNWGAAKGIATPYMDSFLAASANGLPKFQERVWEMIGYLVSPDRYGKCFFILQGVPNSGKSVLGSFIQALFPQYRVSNLNIDQLNKKTASSQLMDKSINISMDLPNKALAPIAIRNIKQITGNDQITVEHSNGAFENYSGHCKFLFATNHALTLRGADSGLEERIVCIPFTYSIPATQRNPSLLYCLLNEKDSIVAKALAYYRDLRYKGYIFSGSEYELFKPRIRYIPTEAEDSDSSLCEFVETRCEFVSDDKGIHTADLYKNYIQFCKELNITPIDNERSFSRRLVRCYGEQLVKKKWRKNGESTPQWGFTGIAIQPVITVN